MRFTTRLLYTVDENGEKFPTPFIPLAILRYIFFETALGLVLSPFIIMFVIWLIHLYIFAHNPSDFPLRDTAIVMAKTSSVDPNGDTHYKLTIQDAANNQRYYFTVYNSNLWGELVTGDKVQVGFGNQSQPQRIYSLGQDDCMACHDTFWDQ